jgi:hypothetical protein
LADEPTNAEIPDLPVPELPQPMGFTTVEAVQCCQTELQPFAISLNFINHGFECIRSISVLNTRKFDYTSTTEIDQLKKHSNTFARMLKHWLSISLRQRIPLGDLIFFHESIGLGIH